MKAFADRYPVTPGHHLIIPKAHRHDFFELNETEWQDAQRLIHELKVLISAQDKTISGFNVGLNCGQSAGQTVFHCHIHVIPRRDGDMGDPRGGVRGVIPERQKY